MSRALFIGPAEQTEIDAAVARAKGRPIAFEAIKAMAIDESGGEKTTVSLADRKKAIGQRRPPSENVLLPFGYRAAISFEQQPAGLVRHLSVSVDTRGRVPNEPAIEMIAKAFGFRLKGPGKMWLEEFEPGHHAVNVVEICE